MDRRMPLPGESREFRADGISLVPPVKQEIDALRGALAKKLRIDKNGIRNLRILRKSIDARKKPEIFVVYSIVAELDGAYPKPKIKGWMDRGLLRPYQEEVYIPPVFTGSAGRERPVIVGTGPAGLFCGYILANAGLQPILIERGKVTAEREKDVSAFWIGNPLNTESNVQFGEGGAGTFSDGKLYSHIMGKGNTSDTVMKTFAKFGAGDEILYQAHPHVGTDRLKKVIVNMREAMIEMGAEFRFSTRLDGLCINDYQLYGAKFTSEGKTEELPLKYLALCIGHSARDTFRMLHASGVEMTAKPFAVGLRIQHPQQLINLAQYGEGYERKELPPVEYKLTAHPKSGRSVYSFCMCPGGYVVNASSEEGRLAVNGMSYSGRDSGIANSALVVSVDAADYGNELFDGMHFQERLEEAAWCLGRGAIPIETLGDYRIKQELSKLRKGFTPAIKGNFCYASLHDLLPEALSQDLLEAMSCFGEQIRGYDQEDALLAGVESRTSSPFRIPRDMSGQSNIRGLFPAGEGAGYAGGITSAAVDGIRTAEHIIRDMMEV